MLEETSGNAFPELSRTAAATSIVLPGAASSSTAIRSGGQRGQLEVIAFPGRLEPARLARGPLRREGHCPRLGEGVVAILGGDRQGVAPRAQPQGAGHDLVSLAGEHRELDPAGLVARTVVVGRDQDAAGVVDEQQGVDRAPRLRGQVDRHLPVGDRGELVGVAAARRRDGPDQARRALCGQVDRPADGRSGRARLEREVQLVRPDAATVARRLDVVRIPRDDRDLDLGGVSGVPRASQLDQLARRIIDEDEVVERAPRQVRLGHRQHPGRRGHVAEDVDPVRRLQRAVDARRVLEPGRQEVGTGDAVAEPVVRRILGGNGTAREQQRAALEPTVEGIAASVLRRQSQRRVEHRLGQCGRQGEGDRLRGRIGGPAHARVGLPPGRLARRILATLRQEHDVVERRGAAGHQFQRVMGVAIDRGRVSRADDHVQRGVQAADRAHVGILGAERIQDVQVVLRVAECPFDRGIRAGAEAKAPSSRARSSRGSSAMTRCVRAGRKSRHRDAWRRMVTVATPRLSCSGFPTVQCR